ARMRAGWLGCLLTACTFSGTPATPGDARRDSSVTIDASDASVLGDASCTTYSTQFDTCAHAAGSASLSLAGDYTYDTDDGTLTDTGGTVTPVQHEVIATATGDLDVIFVTTFTLTN